MQKKLAAGRISFFNIRLNTNSEDVAVVSTFPTLAEHWTNQKINKTAGNVDGSEHR